MPDNAGKIVQIIGPVLDVQFNSKNMPQIFNAQRFKVSLDGLQRTMGAFDACMALPAFQQAQPSACPDNEA